MKNFKFFYFFLFFLLVFEVKAELAFEYHVGVRPLAQTSIIDADGDAINRDLLEDPTGIAFSSDGLKSFTTNKKGDDDKGKCVTETTLTVPYDFRQAQAIQKEDSKITEFATTKYVLHAHPDQSLDSVMAKLGSRRISRLPVVSREDPTRLLGIITSEDVILAFGKVKTQRDKD